VTSGLEIGASIGGYQIDEPIGRGGMGVVYAATHTRLRRKAALKILSPELADDDMFRERFIRESQLVASLDHPSVIPIYDANEEDGVLYLAMRYVKGLDLERMLEEHGRLELSEALRIIEPVASALDEAHAHDLIHRDVKPANILIEQQTRHVYLTDFGLARLGSSTGFTRTGSFLGTVHYCSPEQIEGKKVGGRADIYSLGCVLYHCLTGQPPFPRESEVAVIHAHLADPPPALTTVRPDLPRYLDGAIVTAMAKFPEVRYASGEEFVKALRDAGGTTAPELPQHDTGPPPALSTVVEPVLIEPSPPTAVTVSRRARRRSWLIGGAVAAVAVAALAAIGLVLVSGSSSGRTPTQAAPSPPPPKPLASLVAPRMNTKLIPLQRRLTDRVELASRSRSSFLLLERAGGALRSAALETQGWAGAGLVPHTKSDAAVKRLFAAALAAQAAYAKSIEALPENPSAFTRPLALKAINLADRAEEAYARLSGAAPTLPTMPVRRADHLHLLDVVALPRPKPQPRTETTAPPTTTIQSQPTNSTSLDQSAVAAVITDHWQAINEGDYDRAYSYLSPRIQSQFSRSNWVKDKLIDRPRSSPISIQSISIEGDTAYAYVNFKTIGQETSADNTGCNSWTGSYRFVRAGSNWYLDKSNLQRTSHDCSTFSL
jgi:serine/threonine-protein kinase